LRKNHKKKSILSFRKNRQKLPQNMQSGFKKINPDCSFYLPEPPCGSRERPGNENGIPKFLPPPPPAVCLSACQPPARARAQDFFQITLPASVHPPRAHTHTYTKHSDRQNRNRYLHNTRLTHMYIKTHNTHIHTITACLGKRRNMRIGLAEAPPPKGRRRCRLTEATGCRAGASECVGRGGTRPKAAQPTRRQSRNTSERRRRQRGKCTGFKSECRREPNCGRRLSLCILPAARLSLCICWVI
jgi:hypothetical protein